MEIYQTHKYTYIIGQVIKTIFSNYKNPLSLYCICEVAIHETNINTSEKTIRIVLRGPSPENQGTVYKFYGYMETHPKYGDSYIVETYIRDIPFDASQTIEFLSSGLFRGIGRKRAEKIVETLGDDALLQIINSPEILHQIKGIGQETIQQIEEIIIENLDIQKIITKLHEWKISLKVAKKIYHLFGDSAIQKITENPYSLANNIKGIGFNKADDIAKTVNITGDNSNRIKGALEYVLNEIYEHEGSTYGYRNQVIERTSNFLFERDQVRYPYELFQKNISELVNQPVEDIDDFQTDIGQIRRESNRVYLQRYYNYEHSIATKLIQMLENSQSLQTIDPKELVDGLLNLQMRLHFELSHEQKTAVLQSIINKVLIITGGPGTGKSTIISTIVRLYFNIRDIGSYSELIENIILLAPTGRAAKRMSEITEIPSQTIHHFIFVAKEREERNEGRLIIVDEMSMVDIGLFSILISNLRKEDQLILVGDIHQLLPVKAGKAFQDIINSKVFPVIELKKVFRQGEGSDISKLAQSIRDEEISHDLIKESEEIKWVHVEKSGIIQQLKEEIFLLLEKGVLFNEIQILAPIHLSKQGITSINKKIQQLLINQEITVGCPLTDTGFSNNSYSFFTGDRVIQLKNDSEKGISNGDIGKVVKVLPSMEINEYNPITQMVETIPLPKRLVVKYGEKIVEYTQKEIDEIHLAYCFSVHKAQGSEFPFVILPISNSYQRIINKNLVYTAITRAKKGLIVLGDLDVFIWGLHKKPHLRRTFLEEMLLNSKR